MLVLLPPSEGKSAPARGPRLALSTLSFPLLAATRIEVLGSLEHLCSSQPKAQRVLDLGPTQADEITRNTRLRTSSTAPAIAVYTGVLFEALDAATLTPTQRKRLQETTAIASALWGLVRPSDRIPAYRLSGNVSLPGLGPVAAAWRKPITEVLDATEGAILDLRSGAYQFGGLPQRDDVAVGRVLLERHGKRSVISHHNKATKGRLVRALVSSRAKVATLDDIARIAHSIGIMTELEEPARGPALMDFIVTEI